MKAKKTKKSQKKERPNQFLRYTGMATQMALIIAAGVFGGRYLDEELQMDTPWFTLGGSLFSVAVALYFTIKDLSR